MMHSTLQSKFVVAGRAALAGLALFAGLTGDVWAAGSQTENFAQPERRELLTMSSLNDDDDAVWVSDSPEMSDPSLAPVRLLSGEGALEPESAEGSPIPSPLAAVRQAEAKPPLLSGEKWNWIPMGMVPYIGPRTPDEDKDLGIGSPLAGRGWRKQPFSISGFSGFTFGGALMPGHVWQQPSYYGGFNVGWDYDHYWGIEKRLGFGALNLTDSHHDPIGGTNFSITGEYRLMYYPLGDARWRPFLTTGLGWSDFYFHDDHGNDHLDTVGMVPFGLGLKYLRSEHVAVRIDLIDELTFAGGALSTFHYVALTAGVEVRYGHRLLKMPWHKSEAVEN